MVLLCARSIENPVNQDRHYPGIKKIRIGQGEKG